MTDEIVLTLPRDRRYYDVAHLVVGGLAIRLNLTVDNLADLQLALAGLLPRTDSDGELSEMTVALRLDDGTLEGRIGPFAVQALRQELDREGQDGYGMHHVLETVFDSYAVDDDSGTAWVRFTKKVTSNPKAG